MTMHHNSKKFPPWFLALVTVLVLPHVASPSKTPAPPSKLSADFVMERSLKVLRDTISSSGRLTMGGPGLLRWETMTPSKSVLVINKQSGWIHYPDLSVTKRFEIDNDPVMKVLSEHLLVLTGGEFEKIDSLYNVEILKNGTRKLVPKEAQVGELISEIRVLLSPNGVASRVDLVSAKGDTTSISFKNIRINPDLSKTLFDAPGP